jgi:UDP-glucose 4-epimerase
MNAFVTGAAGFIGSHLVDRLLAQGHTVIGFDNFSTGHEEFLAEANFHKKFRLERGDVLDFERLRRAMDGADFVFHLAANADVRFGTQHPRKDLEQNAIATWNVIEAMRSCGVRRLAFSSTGSVYGEPDVFPTPENCPFPVQTSLYAASKLAAEGMIEAYCEGFGMQAYIFRLVSVLGPRYSHGHVIDFYTQLREHPHVLNVLGNGRQRKSYLHVADCVHAILYALEHASGKVQRFNLGTNEYCEVNDSISWITDHLGAKPHIVYSGGERGWTGDSPFIFLDCSAIRSLGWKPRVSIREAVVDTLKYLGDNGWLLPAAQRRVV